MSKITSEKTLLCCFCFLPESPGGHAISRQKHLKLPGVSYLLIELFYVGMPVVRTDGRTYAHVIPKFLGWIYYQVFSGMGLCARAWRSTIKSFLKMQTKEKVESLHLGLASYHPWTRHRVVVNQAKEKW